MGAEQSGQSFYAASGGVKQTEKLAANNSTVEIAEGVSLVSSSKEGWRIVVDSDVSGSVEITYKIGSDYYETKVDISGPGEYYIGDGNGKNGINYVVVEKVVVEDASIEEDISHDEECSHCNNAHDKNTPTDEDTADEESSIDKNTSPDESELLDEDTSIDKDVSTDEDALPDEDSSIDENISTDEDTQEPVIRIYDKTCLLDGYIATQIGDQLYFTYPEELRARGYHVFECISFGTYNMHFCVDCGWGTECAYDRNHVFA